MDIENHEELHGHTLDIQVINNNTTLLLYTSILFSTNSIFIQINTPAVKIMWPATKFSMSSKASPNHEIDALSSLVHLAKLDWLFSYHAFIGLQFV